MVCNQSNFFKEKQFIKEILIYNNYPSSAKQNQNNLIINLYIPFIIIIKFVLIAILIR